MKAANLRHMQPFPSKAELQFLMGLEVGQICLDPWSTQVRFSEGGQITIEGPYEHFDAQGQSHRHQAGEEQDLGPVFIRELIRQRIVRVESDGRHLILTFGNGARLRIYAEVSPYESGQIYPPGQENSPIIF